MILNNKNYSKLIFIFTLGILSFFYSPTSLAVSRELCSPCYAGDGGQLRVGGSYYHGVKAQGAQCTSDHGGMSCWYVSTAGNYWTSCYCPTSSGGGGGSAGGGLACGQPAPWETKKCSTFNDNWYNPENGQCPNKNICIEFQPAQVTCGNTATICNGTISHTCGTPCDAGCPGRTQCGMCGNAACCTSAASDVPTPLTPSNNSSLTTNSAINLTWSTPSNWGTDCNNAANYYAVRVTNNGSTTTVYPSTNSYSYAPGSCNSTVSWNVAAYNGSVWSAYSSNFNFTNTGYTGPSASISSTTTAVSNPNSISFTASATDPDSNLSWIRLRIDRISGYGTGSTSMTTVYNSSNVTCSGSSCSTTFSWSPAVSDSNYYYAAYVLAADSCGYVSALSTPHIFQVAPTYNLQVNVKKTGLVIPDSNGNIDFNSVCSSSTTNFSNVNVTYYAGGSNGGTQTSNSSGVALFSNISQSQVDAGVTLTAAPNSVQNCESFDFYCYEGASQVGHRVDFTGTPVGGTKIVTIALGEEKKDSWETVFDGDIFARNANVSVSCSSATAGGGFEATTIVEDTIGGYFRTGGYLNSSNTDDVYTGNNSGYAKNLDNLESNTSGPLKSADAWFSNFSFPDLTSSSAPTINTSSFNTIQGNRIYKSGNLSVSGSYNLGSSDAVSIVYVDGDLNFTGNLTSNNGFVLFVVKGNVVVDSSVGISNYTDGVSFTNTTSPNITAGIMSLGDITFASTGSSDLPVILNGFVMNRGDLYFNRDLLENNDMYPAHVIKFNTKILSMLSDLEESISTGLSTYDAQWVYDN